ncbi:Type 1 glutamine amidotransferase-like domain-containing protein, partial [Candidatus Bathyarchaeota archaeon]|nr:Type 1 glutamine amidotransferase-like domain-containing protein [Candidatus Bathyarchaeota archaeon]
IIFIIFIFMKLLLTSKGLYTENIIKTLFNLLTKPAKETKVQIMGVKPNIPNFDMKAYFSEDNQKLILKGVKAENIYEHELGEENPPDLHNIDILLMLGGNEYHYIYNIRKHGFEAKIKDFLDRGGIYVGRSAGAIVMGPDVDIKLWSTFTNDIELQNTSGLGFVDFITVPHIDSRKEPEKVVEFHRKTGKKMIYLTDEQGILVIDGFYKII